METSQSTSQPKQKKSIKTLWAKVKASMKSDSSINKPTTTAVAAPKEAPAPAPVSTTTEPVVSPEPTKKMEPEKPTEPMKQKTEMIEVDDNEEPEEDIKLPQITSSRAITSDKEKFARAQEVFDKYNMTFDAADWRRPSKSTVERVEKKPRMRVRYTCHECNKVFGREKICSECNHNRCNKCVRYPAKKTGEKAKKEKPTEVTSGPLAPITTGACHECKTEFTIGDAACGNCEHKICERCLRETVLASPSTAPPTMAKPLPIAVAAS